MNDLVSNTNNRNIFYLFLLFYIIFSVYVQSQNKIQCNLVNPVYVSGLTSFPDK